MLARVFIAALALAASTVVGMPVARADSNDDDFVQKVHNIGVNGAPADLITNARIVRHALNNGSEDTLRDDFVNQMGFTCKWDDEL